MLDRIIYAFTAPKWEMNALDEMIVTGFLLIPLVLLLLIIKLFQRRKRDF